MEKKQIGWFEGNGFRFPIYDTPEDNLEFNEMLDKGLFNKVKVYKSEDNFVKMTVRE